MEKFDKKNIEENSELKWFSSEEPKKNFSDFKEEIVAKREFKNYNDWAEYQNKKSFDLYEKKEAEQIDWVEDELNDFKIMEQENPHPEKAASQISSFFSSVQNTAFSLYSVSKNLIYYPQKVSLVIQKNPLANEASSIVLQLLPVKESKEWNLLLEAMPEKQLKEFVGALKELPKLYTNKLNELMGVDTKIEAESLLEVINKLFSIADSLKMSDKNNEFENLKPLINELVAPIKNPNLQVISDSILGATCYVKKGKQLRNSDQIKEFKEKNIKSDDVSFKYLADQNFKELSPSICSSTVWEMELGKDRGEWREFEKGYCKVTLALPGIDLREIRIPFDIRFLKLNKAEQQQIFFSMFGEMIASPENKIGKYVTREGLENEIYKQFITLAWNQKFEVLEKNNPALKEELLSIKEEIFDKGNWMLMEILLKDEWPEWGKEALKAMSDYPNLVKSDRIYKYLNERTEEVRFALLNLKSEDFDQIKKMLETWPSKPKGEELSAYENYVQKIKNFDQVLNALKETYSHLSSEKLFDLFNECKNLFDHKDDEQLIASIQVLNDCKQLGDGKNLELVKKILTDLDAEGVETCQKFAGPQGDYSELMQIFNFTRAYAEEMLQKAFSSLGKDEIHFDGVVSHFEVFPKQILQHFCSDKTFKNNYDQFLMHLHAIRLVKIQEHSSASIIDEEIVQSMSMSLNESLEKMYNILAKSSLSTSELKSVKKYIKYMAEFSKSPLDNSSFTQLSTINQLLKQWNELSPVIQKGVDVQIALWLSDPSACYLVSEFLQYSELVKQENSGKNISMSSFHNKKLQSITIDLIRNLNETDEVLDKKMLISSLKRLVYSSFDPKFAGDNLEVIDFIVDLEELEKLLPVWHNEKLQIARIDNTNLLSKISDGADILITKEIKSQTKLIIKNLKNLLPEESKEIFRDLETIKDLELAIDSSITKNNLDKKISRKDLSELITNFKTWGKFKQLLIDKVLPLIPADLNQKEKENLRLKFEINFSFLTPFKKNKFVETKELIKILDFLDHLKLQRQKEILRLYNPHKIDIKSEDIILSFSELSNHLGLICLYPSMIPIMETMTPLNVQTTVTTTGMAFYHPSYIQSIHDIKGVEGADSRYMRGWNVNENTIKQNPNEMLLGNDHYVERAAMEHLKEKVLWHMEQGSLCEIKMEEVYIKKTEKKLVEKISRFFKSGFGEISLAILSVGRIRSCQYPIDLTPFDLHSLEDTHDILSKLSKAFLEKDRREAIINIVQDLKKIEGNRFEGIIKNQDLFIEIGLQFIIKMDKALAKTLASVNNPSIHFSDVEEINLMEDPSQEKNEFSLKMIQKGILTAFLLEKGDEKTKKKERLEQLQGMLFPFLSDTVCLKAFNNWTKALQVARKANNSLEEISGKEFHNVRLEKKKLALIEMLNSVEDMHNDKKSQIQNWIEQQFYM